MNIKEKLIELANEFDSAKRHGFENDSPEGIRYIIVSDTLAKEISSTLRNLSDAITEHKPTFIEIRNKRTELYKKWKDSDNPYTPEEETFLNAIYEGVDDNLIVELYKKL